MLYDQFKVWLKDNLPVGEDEYAFLEFCAMIGCLTLQQNMNEEGITIDELMGRLFDKPRQMQ